MCKSANIIFFSHFLCAILLALKRLLCIWFMLYENKLRQTIRLQLLFLFYRMAVISWLVGYFTSYCIFMSPTPRKLRKHWKMSSWWVYCYNLQQSQSNLSLRIKTKPVPAGADASTLVWLLLTSIRPRNHCISYNRLRFRLFFGTVYAYIFQWEKVESCTDRMVNFPAFLAAAYLCKLPIQILMALLEAHWCAHKLFE